MRIENKLNMKAKRPEQRLFSFAENSEDISEIQNDVSKNGWFIASVYSNGRSYVGILEKKSANTNDGSIYIPPRKKIRITSN